MTETLTESLSSLSPSILAKAVSTPTALTAAGSSTTIPDVPPPSPGLINWMFYFIASCIVGATRIFFWILSFCTITIPTLIFKILSISFTLTLNFSSLYALLPLTWTYSVFSSLLSFYLSVTGFFDIVILLSIRDFPLNHRGRNLKLIYFLIVRRVTLNQAYKITSMRLVLFDCCAYFSS